MRNRARIAMLFLLATACEGRVRPILTTDAQKPDMPQTDFQIPDSEADLKPPPSDSKPDSKPDSNGSPCTDQEAHLNGYCYRALGFGLMTYQMASETCASGDYTPVSIHSAEENELVYSLLYMWTECAWIGLTRNTGTYAWDDGSPLDFENWEPNEPDSDTCACIGGPNTGAAFQGLWQDARCTRQFREIVCKRKP